MRLQAHVAVVTGASSGIGQAIAIALAREGAAVILVDHEDRKGVQETGARISAAGGNAHVVEADIRAEADVERLFSEAAAALGTVTLLVNSAGVDSGGKKVRDMSLDQWENVLRTNLTGAFLAARAFLRGLGDAPGKIINISSVHQEIPRVGAAEYCASKGGLHMLTRTLALEGAPNRVTANVIAPGMVLTPMNQEAIDDPKVLEEQVQSIPLKRAAKPEEVAALAVYLAGPDADYISGATFTIDGGLHINLGQGA